MTLFCHRSKQSILSCLFYHLSVFKWHLCGCHMWSMVTKESYYVPKSKKGTSVLMYRKHNCTYTFTVSYLYVYQMYMQCFTWCTQHAYLHNPCTTFTILTNFYYKLRWVSPRLSLHWFSVCNDVLTGKGLKSEVLYSMIICYFSIKVHMVTIRNQA